MTGTLVRLFGGLTGLGESVQLECVVYFPWATEERKFCGETIYSIRSTAGDPS
jgi:hypothetical protein